MPDPFPAPLPDPFPEPLSVPLGADLADAPVEDRRFADGGMAALTPLLRDGAAVRGGPEGAFAEAAAAGLAEDDDEDEDDDDVGGRRSSVDDVRRRLSSRDRVSLDRSR